MNKFFALLAAAVVMLGAASAQAFDQGDLVRVSSSSFGEQFDVVGSVDATSDFSVGAATGVGSFHDFDSHKIALFGRTPDAKVYFSGNSGVSTLAQAGALLLNPISTWNKAQQMLSFIDNNGNNPGGSSNYMDITPTSDYADPPTQSYRDGWGISTMANGWLGAYGDVTLAAGESATLTVFKYDFSGTYSLLSVVGTAVVEYDGSVDFTYAPEGPCTPKLDSADPNYIECPNTVQPTPAGNLPIAAIQLLLLN